MGVVEQNQLVNQLSPPADRALAEQLVREFVSLERRFIQRDWEPTELDAGQFAEILARILFHLDSGTLNPSKKFDDCLKYIEDEPPCGRNHAIQPRSTATHIAKALRCTYKFRSDRGAVHISPTYSANHLDSRFMVECARWCMAETVRWLSAGKPSHEEAAKIIRELLQFEVPAVGKYGDRVMVQRTDLKCEEEILILLHHAGESGMSRRELGAAAMHSPPSITNALKDLASRESRQIVEVEGKFRLTDLGSKRVRDEISDRLLVQ